MFFDGPGVEISPFMLLGIGLAVGILSGFFGFGGGFITTPALNFFGFPMPWAIGTDMTQMAGSAVMSTMKHRKFGHVDMRLALIMVAASVAGVQTGNWLVMYMEGLGNVDMVVRWIYIVLLGGLGLYMLKEASTLSAKAAKHTLGVKRPPELSKSPLVTKVQSLNIPPFISLPVSGITRISAWVPLGIGFSTGLLAGLLGVGGGFIRMPALIYLMGVPTVVAVGTDLFEVIVSGSYGAFTYGLAHRVELLAALLVLVGASAGVQIGALATRYVRSERIRHCFAITVLFAGVSVFLKQVAAMSGLGLLNTAATVVLLGVAGGMALLITILLIKAGSAALGAQVGHGEAQMVRSEQSKWGVH